MVKGVNKTVIEVNNTGSKMFDRVVFYVNPSYSNLSTKNLNSAIKNFSFMLDGKQQKFTKTLRQRAIIKRRIFIALVLAGVFAASIVLAVIL